MSGIAHLGLLYHACVSESGQRVQITLGDSVVASSLLAITGASALRRILDVCPLTRLSRVMSGLHVTIWSSAYLSPSDIPTCRPFHCTA